MNFLKIFSKHLSNITFHEKPNIASHIIPCGKTDGQTDVGYEGYSNFSLFYERVWEKKYEVILYQSETILGYSYNKTNDMHQFLKFILEKLVNFVGFIIRIYITMHGFLNVKKYSVLSKFIFYEWNMVYEKEWLKKEWKQQSGIPHRE
jgi:hypothetical protein